MAARTESVAKYICEKFEWTINNRHLQKILYLSQMIHMGRHDGKPLFEDGFMAIDFGPVTPHLYQKLKRYGPGPLKDVFYNALNFKKDDPRVKVMDDVIRKFSSWTYTELLAITHEDKSAWAKHYTPKCETRIPPESILEEYQWRITRKTPEVENSPSSEAIH